MLTLEQIEFTHSKITEGSEFREYSENFNILNNNNGGFWTD